MKTIPLSQGKFALVDDSDYEWLNKWDWYALKGAQTFYAVRRTTKDTGHKMIQMHRLILGLTDPKILVDHRDFNGLNNQRSNLRTATPSQNSSNRQPIKGSTSKYIGVHWFKNAKLWTAQIKKKGKLIKLGYFKIEENAAVAYNNAAIKLHGEFANLNKIDESLLKPEPKVLRRSPVKNSSSKYLGVCIRKKGKRYEANITIKGEHKYLGSFNSEIDAALAYNKASIEAYGEFANLNKF